MTDIFKPIEIPYVNVGGTLVPLSLLGIETYIPELEETPEEVYKQIEERMF